jgi:general secretion pathway protein D
MRIPSRGLLPDHAMTPKASPLRWTRRCATLMAAAWLTLAFPASLAAEAARPPAAGRTDRVVLKFVNADIEGVAQAIGNTLGRTFVLDSRVKGRITVLTPKPVSKAAAYEVFLSALRVQGFAAVEEDGLTKIVPEAEARQHPGPTFSEAPGARGSAMVTRIFRLQYESAAQLATLLRPMVAGTNNLVAHPGSNSLVITDYASNLGRIEQILAALDKPGQDQPAVVRLESASAIDVALVVNRTLADGVAPVAVTGAAGAAGAPTTTSDPSTRLTAVADPRSNSVILRSSSASRIARARALIAELDTPPRNGPNIRVIALKFADATKMATVLRGVVSSMPGVATGGDPAAAAGTASTTGTAGVAPGANVGTFGSSYVVQADPANNALVVNAPDAVYNAIRAAVDQMDTRRPQVLIEALLVELTAEKAAEFGVQWQMLDSVASGGTRAAGGTNFGTPGEGRNILDAARNLGTVGRGINVGIVSGTTAIPGLGTITNLSLLARALESNAKANILSTPNILTLDNEEAKIVIGQNVPIVTGQYAQTGAAVTPTPFQTIERRDVGITLKVRPLIMQGGSVRLQLYQEASTVQDRTNASGIITNKRTIESTVLVDDGQIIALGGLIEDKLSNDVDQVPGLGSLPIIGNLFRYESRRRTKTNLMVFLRPYIVRSAEALDAVSEPRYEDAAKRMREGDLESRFGLPAMEAPRMPERAAEPRHGRQ